MQLSNLKRLFSLLALPLAASSYAATTKATLWNVNSAVYTSGATVGPIVQSGGESALSVNYSVQWGQIGQKFTTPKNWSAYNGYSFAVENKENRQVTMGFRIELNAARTSVVGVAFTLEPNERKRFYLDLIPPLDNNLLGMRSLPPLMNEFYTVLRPWAGSPTINDVYSWQIYSKDVQPAKVAITSIDGYTVDPTMAKICNSFGQYTGAWWTQKVATEAELPLRAIAETAELAANPGPGETTGSLTLPVSASGKWQVVQSPTGKSYFRHPDGKAFWSLGMVSVKNGAPTIVQGREHMHNWLPPSAYGLGQNYGTHNGKKTYDYHGANLMRKYGPNWKQPALDRIYKRMESWGFNTMGSGSDNSQALERNMPYTLTVTTDSFATKLALPLAFWRQLADPFTAGFEDWMASSFYSQIRYSNGNKAFMGLFVDGENVWCHRDGTTAGYYMLPIGVLAAPASQPAKKPFVDALKAKYVNVSALNTAWNTSFVSWDAMMDPFTVNPAGITDAMKADFSQQIKDFAVKYYSHVRTALTRAGLTGLFLGTKDCMAWTPDEIHQVAASYVDTISITYYAAAQNVPWSYFNSLGKPVLIAEFSFMGRDRGAMSGGFAPDVDVATQNDRAAATEAYIRGALQAPNVVGVHWFSYLDQPMTGRPQDGENFFFGMVDVTDTPYPEMISMVRNLTSNMYQYRGW